MGIDQFKQFIRKELIEKYNINKTSFNKFREELAEMFKIYKIEPVKDKIRVSNSFKRILSDNNNGFDDNQSSMNYCQNNDS